MSGWNEDFDCYVPYGYKLVPDDEADYGPEPDKMAQRVALCNTIQSQHLALNLISSTTIAVTQVLFEEADKAKSLEEFTESIRRALAKASTPLPEEPDR